MRKNLKEDKIQTGLRIPEKQYERLIAISTRVGVSINALILVLIDVGLNQIECQPEESYHSFFQNPPNISG